MKVVRKKPGIANALMALGICSATSWAATHPDFDKDRLMEILRVAGTYALRSMDEALQSPTLSQVSALDRARLLVRLITLSYIIRVIAPASDPTIQATFGTMKTRLLNMLAASVQLALPGVLEALMAQSFDGSTRSELQNLYKEIDDYDFINKTPALGGGFVVPCKACSTVHSKLGHHSDQLLLLLQKEHDGAAIICAMHKALLCDPKACSGVSGLRHR